MTARIEHPEPPRGLGALAARGAFLTYLGQGARIVIQVLSVVILSRLLDAGDYGLIAMVLAVVGVGEIFRDFGLSSAAIQARSLSDQQRTNLFWINTAIGVLLAAIVYLGAGLVAALYGRPELVDIARVLSLTFVVNGLATQFRAQLARGLKFVQLAIADVLSPVAGLAVAVVCALHGWEYWALVAQQLTQGLVLLVALAVASRWMPGLPRRNADMGGLLTFGGNLVATQLVGYLGNNLDSIVIGTRFGANPLGLYNRSFQLLMSPLTQLRAPTTTVALPVLARLHDDDDRYSRFLVRGQLALGYTLVAGLGLVVGGAEPLTLLLLGDGWTGVAPILRLLAIAGIFQTLSYVGYWVYLSRGLTADLFRYSLVTTAIKIACILVGSTGGVIGVAAGYAIAPAIAWPISLWWLSRRTALPTRLLVTGALRTLGVTAVIAAATGGASIAASALPLGIEVAIALLAGCGALALIAVAVPALRADARGIVEIAGMVRSKGAR